MTKAAVRTRPVPQRTCVGCSSTTNKRELVRVVRTPEGVVADPTGKKAGRGAYVHHDPACWTQALKKGRLARSLKTTISAADITALEAYAGTVEEA